MRLFKIISFYLFISFDIRYCRLDALILCILFSIEGFVNEVLRLYSRKIPDLSYFFLNRFKALSIFSPDCNVTPTTAKTHLTYCSIINY